MSNQTIAAALASRLAALALPTQYENSAFTPVAGVVYLSEALLPSTTVAVGVSTTSSDEFSGIYQVTVHAPKGGTKGPGMAAAKAIQDQFPRGLELVRDGIKVTVLRSSQAPGFIDGDRWLIPVSIDYRALV